MKIAIVVREYHKHGGISKVITEIAEKIASSGNDVHVFTGNYEKIKNEKVFIHKIPMIRASIFSKLGLPKIAKFFQGVSFCIFSRFYCNYKLFDIVHVNGDTLAKFDIRMAHSCHRAWLKLANRELKGPFDWIKKNLNPHHWRILITEKFNFKRGNYKKIIAISEKTKQEIIENYKIPSEDIVVIPLGVDLDEFTPDNRKVYRKEIREKYKISDEEIVLLFVGYDFRRKGLEFVIRAIDRLKNKNIKLMVIGKDKILPYENLARQLNLSDKIIFAGAQIEMNKFYSAGDIFVFPTMYEPFGLVIIEAMASGLPVIVSKLAGAAELISNGKEGFLLDNPKDINQLAFFLDKLVNDNQLRINMGQNARKKAESFSWDKISHQILDLYSEVLKTKK